MKFRLRACNDLKKASEPTSDSPSGSLAVLKSVDY
jgi:hypothetical protein